MNSFVKTEARMLPKVISYTSQSAFAVKPADIKRLHTGLKNLPVVVFVNKEGVINYISEGYRIGIGDELLSLIK